MSELKRVEFTTVQPSSKDKKVKKKHTTFRFVLSLGESNSTACPEYSFSDLIKNERKLPDDADPFDDPNEDSEVAAIAQRFEAKYGPKTVQRGKKRTQEMDDYYDLGDGYDEDDPFIDNTEAYDEVVPSSITTKHGGFYINQGKLDFRSVNEDSIDDFSSPQGKKKKKKKRALDSDSEEETGEALAKKFKAMKRKKLLESKEGEKKKKKLANGQDGDIIIKKKKKKNLEKLKLKKLSTQSDLPPPKEAPSPSLPASSTAAASTTLASPEEAAASKPATSMTNGTSEVKSESQAKDAVVSKTSVEEMSNAILQETMKDDSSSKSGEEGKGDQQAGDRNVQLPPQLPPQLSQAIDNIKKEAKESKEGKSKFFSANVNKLLLEIELGSRRLAWGSRTAIYNYLGEHLPCGKHALQRRAKKLRESQQDDQLKVPVQKLKDAVLKVMPALEEQHGLDVARAKLEAEIDEAADAVKEEASTESEGEEKADKKKPRGPRRKFQWQSEMKDLLLEIVSAKMKLYNTCKSRNQTPEEYLRAYLDSDIRPIWPQGWMQTRMLFKESRAAHEEYTKGTPQQAKQKKLSTSGKPGSPAPDSMQSNVDSARSHVSKTEDVIEISSRLESSLDNSSVVVVNLPNSDIKSMPQLTTGATPSSSPVSQLSMSNLQSASSNFGKKQMMKPTTTTTSTVTVLQPHTTSQISQKSTDAPVNSSVKRITPTQVMRVPPLQVVDVTESQSTQSSSPAQRTLSTTKPFAPNATSTPLASGSSSASASSTFNSSSRSFLEAFDTLMKDVRNKTDSVTSTTGPLQRQTAVQQLNQQHQKSSPSQQLQQHHKVSTLQQKSITQQQMANLQQQKLPQEQQKVTQTQAALRSPSSSVVSKDIPNSPWSTVSSVVPLDKSISPVVSVNRILTTSYSQQGALSNSKNSQALIQQHHKILLQQQQQAKMLNSGGLKQHQNLPHKKRQQPNITDSGNVISSTTNQHQLLKSGAMTQHVNMSSKLDSPLQNRSVYPPQQKHLNSPGINSASAQKPHSSVQQLKSGIVIGTSNSMQKLNFPQHQQTQHLKTGIVLGTSTGSAPQLTGRSGSNTDFASSKQSAGSGIMKQPSPPKRITPTSITSGWTPPSATSGLLNSNPASRGSTPSPQKSPLSPGGNACLSLYEQIQSQIRSQEAIEGQALKNLALALTSVGNADHSGKGNDSSKSTGQR